MLKKSVHFSLLLGFLKYHDHNLLFSVGMNAETCIFLSSIKYTCKAYLVYTGKLHAVMARFRPVQLSMDAIMQTSQKIMAAVLTHHVIFQVFP